MTPGAFVLAVRRRFNGGPLTSWYREIIRPAILKAEPLTGTTDDGVCEVHVLTSGDDWLNACWAIRSFYRAAGRSYALCVHDDGTLSMSGYRAMRRQFPDARIVKRSQADAEVMPWLASYPRCAKFRHSNKLAMKVFDMMYYGKGNRWMLLDSDVLFFSYPTELLQRIENPDYRLNSANADVASAYTVRSEDVRIACGFRPIERFNSGLCLFHRDSLRLEWLEEFLSLPDILSHPWRIEQTLFALASSRFGVELLPGAYSVKLDRSIGERPCKHYVGAIRNYMYVDGMATLRRQGMLKSSVASTESTVMASENAVGKQ
jgi:hypothetical protein